MAQCELQPQQVKKERSEGQRIRDYDKTSGIGLSLLVPTLSVLSLYPPPL